MQITYVMVVAVVTYILGAFTKLKWKSVPSKYIPIQNVVIALGSALICFFSKVETNFLEAIILCFTATMGAGGVYDLVKTLKGDTATKESGLS